MPTRPHFRNAICKMFAIGVLVLLRTPGALTAQAQTQTCTVPGIPGTQPAPRRGHVMAYDSNGRVLLYGGMDAYGNLLGDTWRWDGTSWTLVSSGGPAARRESAMAHFGTLDSDSFANVLLHGGIGSSGNVFDTWKWDGNAWSQLTGTAWNFASGPGHFMSSADGFYNGPPAHSVNVLVGPGLVELNPFGWLFPANGGATFAGGGNGAMADMGVGINHRLVAFAGDQTDVLTWGVCSITPPEYCLGKDTVYPTPRPDVRAHHAMAGDGTGVLLFGGSSGDAQTWRFDGYDTWDVVAGAGPGPRINHAMAYDRQRNRVVLFGGEWNGTVYGDTWEWDGTTNTWTQLRCFCLDPTWVQGSGAPAGLTARSDYAMTYDSLGDRVLVFGGKLSAGTTNQLWGFDGVAWSLLSSTGPAPRSNAALAYDSVRGRTVLFGGLSGGGASLQDTWEWDGISWTQKFPTLIPQARLGHVMGYYAPTARVTLHGGSPGGVAPYLSDTWTWDGTNWALAAAGPARAFGSMTYDPQTQRLVLFGGQTSSGGAPVTSYSLWNGSSWSSPGISGIAAKPTARLGAALAYDPARGRPVLFGGRDGALTAQSDTWELVNYGLFPWSQVTIPGPSARTDLSMTYHQGSSALILFGGATSGLASRLNETWALRADGPPGVTSSSGPQTVCEGSSVTFSATYTGAVSGYEWRHDGNLILGANGPSYTIPSTVLLDAGSYTVSAGNACGAGTSPAMTLAVRSAPHITVQPLSQTVCPGDPVIFNVTATGEAPFSYQWRRNGALVSQLPYVVIASATAGDGGTYKVVITNACGNTTSIDAQLVVACPIDGFRVNVGGPLTAPGDTGPSWSLDTAASPSPYVNAAAYGNNTGSTASAINMSHPSIPAGTPMSLFQTERFDFPGGAEMTWSFPTGPGTFRVRLYFAEIFTGITGAGQRLFDVKIEDQTALHNFDIFAETGGLNRGIVKTFNARVLDGQLDIAFLHGVENPVVFAIEVQRSGNIRVNAGGQTVASGDTGPAWSIDTFAVPSPYANAGATNATGSTGATIDMSDSSIPAGMPMSLFQFERHDLSGGAEMTYNFPTGSGVHLVRLFFSEIFTGITGAGQRVFDVQAEGTTMLKDFDIYKAVGPNKAVARSFAVAVVDSFLTLTFVHRVENPTVMALEIVPHAGFRVNVGGPSRPTLDSGPNWSIDTGGSPSPYVNSVAYGNTTGTTTATINMADPSIPPGTPMSLFQDERHDLPGGSDMMWTFPTGPGSFQVRLYFAEIFSGITAPGQRLFNVNIEGTPMLTNFDIFAQAGLNKGLVKTFDIAVADDALNIDFSHVVENPTVMAIQVVPNAVSAVPAPQLPPVSMLAQNAPNPFGRMTSIEFTMKQSDWAVVEVFDVAGRLVTTLLDSRLPVGAHRVDWDGRDRDGRDVPAGIYWYRLRLAGGFTQARRMLLLK